MTERTPMPGEMWAVKIAVGPRFDNHYAVDQDPRYSHGIVHQSALHPLPPSLTPEAQAVLDRTLDWRTVNKDHPDTWRSFPTTYSLVHAIDAYRASIARPRAGDPVEQLLASAMEAIVILRNHTVYQVAADNLSLAVAAARTRGTKP